MTWSTPAVADGLGITDDFGHTFTRGHQFMPQLTFSQGKLMLLYYDQRLDHTLGLAYPQPASRTWTVPTRQVLPLQAESKGELDPANAEFNPAAVYSFTIADSIPPLQTRRHTIDLRVASRRPFDAAFTATTVTQYKYGLRVNRQGDFVDENGTLTGSRTSPPPLSQLQSNAPNLPLFARGPSRSSATTSTSPACLRFGWRGPLGLQQRSASAPIFYATWTDNRDVVPPADGTGPLHPVGLGGQSLLDPSQPGPPAFPDRAGCATRTCT